MISGRMGAVIAGGVALVILGTVAVASASTPSGGGTPKPEGPSEEDCAQAQAELSALRATRAGLNDEAIALQEAALMAGQAGDPSAAQLAAQANAVIAQRNEVDSAIAELESFIESECQS